MQPDDFVHTLIEAATLHNSSFPYAPIWIVAQGFNWTEDKLREELKLKNYLVDYKKLNLEIRPIKNREEAIMRLINISTELREKALKSIFGNREVAEEGSQTLTVIEVVFWRTLVERVNAIYNVKVEAFPGRLMFGIHFGFVDMPDDEIESMITTLVEDVAIEIEPALSAV